MAKSHLKLVTPATVKRTVTPKRRPNAELRTREHLSEDTKDERTELRQLQRIEPYLRFRFERKWPTTERVDVTALMYQNVSGRLDGYVLSEVEGFRD